MILRCVATTTPLVMLFQGSHITHYILRHFHTITHPRDTLAKPGSVPGAAPGSGASQALRRTRRHLTATSSPLCGEQVKGS